MPQPIAPPRPSDGPRAYLITFTCYGTRFHGDKDASVDRFHSRPHTPLLEENAGREKLERGLSKHPMVTLATKERAVALEAIRQQAVHYGWVLHAAHVRSNHVHAVVEADVPPETVMTQFKANASRALNEMKWRKKRWAQHGSTRYLWDPRDVDAAVEYVVDQQGSAMAVYVNQNRWVEQLGPKR